MLIYSSFSCKIDDFSMITKSLVLNKHHDKHTYQAHQNIQNVTIVENRKRNKFDCKRKIEHVPFPKIIISLLFRSFNCGKCCIRWSWACEWQKKSCKSVRINILTGTINTYIIFGNNSLDFPQHWEPTIRCLALKEFFFKFLSHQFD